MWDQRYASDEYAYGKEPNDFLVECLDRIPRGKVLCVADGEGRNGVYLAESGCEVTSIDASAVGMRKAAQLALERGVQLHTVVADLDDYIIEAGYWDAIVSIFCHLPPMSRKLLHCRIVNGLRPGGTLVLEAYTPDQLQRGTGGPGEIERTMQLKELRYELQGLEFELAEEKVRDVHEGLYHTGAGAVVQLVARKPAN